MPVEDEFLDVLQNIEAVVVMFYRKHRELSDRNILRVYEAVLGAYSAEHLGRKPHAWTPEPFEQDVYNAVMSVCEIRLGRGRGRLAASSPIDVDDLFRCLKRLRGSVQKWIKRYGGRGYLDLIDQFTP